MRYIRTIAIAVAYFTLGMEIGAVAILLALAPNFPAAMIDVARFLLLAGFFLGFAALVAILATVIGEAEQEAMRG